MDSFRYTASARLGLWSTLPSECEEFVAALDCTLQENAHAVIEASTIRYIDDDAALAAIAISDKIATRGNPTLVDLDFEHALVNGPAHRYLRITHDPNDPTIGPRLLSTQFPGTLLDLVAAAEELFCLPFTGMSAAVIDPAVPYDARNLSSREEDIFVEQFKAVFGPALLPRLHRQVLFRELVDCDQQDPLAQNRVDFAFQVGAVKWVFEIDGEQHRELAQEAKDAERDSLLRRQGWSVHRFTAEQVRSGVHAQLLQLSAQASCRERRALCAAGRGSVTAAVAASELHAAALNCIVLPHVAHRCMRGVLHLYACGILDASREQRILVVEEDLPVTAEAFRMLFSLWRRVHVLAPEVSPPPRVQLDVVAGRPALGVPTEPHITTRYVPAPDGTYDVSLSSSCFLNAGTVGQKEEALKEVSVAYSVRERVSLRCAIGLHSARELRPCRPIQYALEDVERAVASQDSDGTTQAPEPANEALHFLLHLLFRKRTFLDGQLRVIARLLQGKPTIVLLPTGGGKSLTYQFSGLLLPGITLVIDPLVSLMNDQVYNLRAAGIDLVGAISSQMEQADKDAVMRRLATGNLAFVFISPERLQIQAFRDELSTAVELFHVSLAVIDEAHCVSEWGHDFRPSYLHMGSTLRKHCSHAGKSPTLVGLTGTASFAVLTDIQMELGITGEEAIIVPRSFDRPELQFYVKTVPMRSKANALDALKNEIPRMLRANPQGFYDLRGDLTNAGIIFCPHVNGSLGVTGVSGHYGHDNYFAGTKPKAFRGTVVEWNEHKQRLQESFKRNHIQEIVATKSFGMGIDKSNIRYTCHYGVPQSVEAFYQEAGRAGRWRSSDSSKRALCAVIYSDDNWDTALQILNEPDHEIALNRLNTVGWSDRGDLMVQLWLLFSSYAGREQEKSQTLAFWAKHVKRDVDSLSEGMTKTIDLRLDLNTRDREEKALYRLSLLGVVRDYTIDWSLHRVSAIVKRINPVEVKAYLRRYLLQYKFEGYAEAVTRHIPEDSLEGALEAGIDVLVDFVYDEIVSKRKQALRTMAELCREFRSDRDFRDSLLAYLQESEFSPELRDWIGHEFDEVGLLRIEKVLEQVTTLEQVKRLVGTTRRMLDEDPQNIALRYLSMCARAQSAAESSSSVVQEASTLAAQVDDRRERLRNPEEVLLRALCFVGEHRPEVLGNVGDAILRRAGTAALARALLCTKLAANATVYHHAVILLAANALRLVNGCRFYTSMRQELNRG